MSGWFRYYSDCFKCEDGRVDLNGPNARGELTLSVNASSDIGKGSISLTAGEAVRLAEALMAYAKEAE